jgi:flavin-dependent dehydrogenase
MTDQQLPPSVDVAIVGAGSAGAATAAFCAERGLSTLCIDRAALADAGASWVNGVPGWAFDDAGLERPTGDELRGSRTVHLVIGHGPKRVVVEDHGVLEVDMAKLTTRLHGLARQHGAQLFGKCAVRGLGDDGLVTDRGEVTARWFVDASGMSGCRLLDQPRVEPGDICVAAQEVHRLVDADAAREFFASHNVPYGQAVCFMGVVGGFSVVQYRCEGDYVSMLVGSVPADGHPSGKQVLDGLVAEHDWIGETIFGGSRAIPIRRPFDRIASRRVAAIGDAAAQVFSAHGSGVGHHLVAARLLADELASERGPQSYGSE